MHQVRPGHVHILAYPHELQPLDSYFGRGDRSDDVMFLEYETPYNWLQTKKDSQ